MKATDLYGAIGQTEESMLERSEKNKHRRRKPWWMGAVAAVLALVLVGSMFQQYGGAPFVSNAYAICEASYPEMAPYPDETSPNFDQQYEDWWASVQGQRQTEGYTDGLHAFLTDSIPQFLSGQEGENKVYSPLNVYMALAMLAELTDGNSRQQILDLVGADSIEDLRTQANAVWNGQYRNDGATTSILASSLWLNEDVSFVEDTMKRLADTYYASSYQGEMGSQELNKALQDWLNAQTGGLLENQVNEITMDPETVMTIATTLYYQAKWAQTFDAANTSPETFHALSGDVTCDFMHSNSVGTYYWGDQFGAVARPLGNDGGTMWFLLPDEGVTVQELLEHPQTMEFLLSGGNWADSKTLRINLSLPKFDVSSQMDLKEGLQALGVTDVFEEEKSNFSPMTTEINHIVLSQAKHGVRVAVDEEGVTAAAYTVMSMTGTGAPPEDEMDFNLNRPFLFAITSEDGLPLFVGSVYQPTT